MAGLREGSPQEAGLDSEKIEQLRERAAQWVSDGTHQNIVLLVARNDVVCLKEAWGTQTPAGDSNAATTDMVFWTASNSKPVTAAFRRRLRRDFGSPSAHPHQRNRLR
jgi:hypothetical protein